MMDNKLLEETSLVNETYILHLKEELKMNEKALQSCMVDNPGDSAYILPDGRAIYCTDWNGETYKGFFVDEYCFNSHGYFQVLKPGAVFSSAKPITKAEQLYGDEWPEDLTEDSPEWDDMIAWVDIDV